MKVTELVAALESLGLSNVRTYIQSGNAVFGTGQGGLSSLARDITETLTERYGLEPTVVLLSKKALETAVKTNPFPEAEAAPKLSHLYSLEAVPKAPDLNRLEIMKAETERFELITDRFYLHAPEGVGRSKLAANVERGLGAVATARNWRTVLALLKLAEQDDVVNDV